MISIAHTKDVVTNGIIRVNQGQWLIMANARAAAEIKKTSQAVLRYFLFWCMLLSFLFTNVRRGAAKIRERC